MPTGGEELVGCRSARWWRLVWCFDRCFLPECEDRRRSLSEATRALGAALICLKRAARLQNWLEEQGRPNKAKNVSTHEGTSPPPYVLMTDHRQAASCVETILNGSTGQLHLPAFVVIHCDHTQQLEAIRPLVRQMQEILPVYVCTELGSPQLFVSRMVQQLTGGTAPLASYALAIEQLKQATPPQLLLWSEKLSPSAEQGQGKHQQLPAHMLESQHHNQQAQELVYLQQPAQQSPVQTPRSSPWSLPPSSFTPMQLFNSGRQPEAGMSSPVAQMAIMSTPTTFCMPALPLGTLPAVAALSMEAMQPSLYSLLQPPAATPMFAAHPASFVDHLLSPIRACGNMELDKLLRAAMPEHYDD